MAKHKGLGRGLDALLGESSSSASASGETGESLKTIAISDLQPGKYQPRAHMDQASLASLAESIKAQGIKRLIDEFAMTHEGAAEAVAGICPAANR